jgi:predicted metal-dependent phosphoesterase TrpH
MEPRASIHGMRQRPYLAVAAEMEQATMTNPASNPRVKRVDLHCHSLASTEADEVALIAIGCPESFSAPADVYLQAKARGMDFATITDHDSVQGVEQILHHPDVFTGEELTCYFPEDGCKMHVLVWGLTGEDHVALQAAASDIYEVARYIEDHQLAHSVAHPVYRQNDSFSCLRASNA